jgi:hypothetical protein
LCGTQYGDAYPSARKYVDQTVAPIGPSLAWDPDDYEAAEWNEKLVKPSQFNELGICNTGWLDLKDGA